MQQLLEAAQGMPDLEAQLAAKLAAARQEQHEGWSPERVGLRLRRRAETARVAHERAQARLATAEEQRALALQGLEEAQDRVEATTQRLADAEVALERHQPECPPEAPPQRDQQQPVPDSEAASTLRRLLASEEGRRLVSEVTAVPEPARKRSCNSGLGVTAAYIGD